MTAAVAYKLVGAQVQLGHCRAPANATESFVGDGRLVVVLALDETLARACSLPHFSVATLAEQPGRVDGELRVAIVEIHNDRLARQRLTRRC